MIKLGVVALILALARVAVADVYKAEPTAGLALPTAPLAGELDGRVVATNPGGASLLRGSELALALDYQRDIAESTGRNAGLFVAGPFGGEVLPRLGIGAGVEWLHASSSLTPDPGNRVRFTLTAGSALGRHVGWGLAWHHFRDDGPLRGLDTYDFGLVSRTNNYLALGAVVSDVATPRVESARVDRRYELEAVVRPLSTDALEVAIGGRLGGDHRDGWIRGTVKLARGLFAHAAIETRNTVRIDDTTMTIEGRDLRLTAGLEVSFGQFGAVALATSVRDDTGNMGFLGGQTVLRLSQIGPSSLLAPRSHIERVELTGTVSMDMMRKFHAIERDPSVAAVVVVLDRISAGPGARRELRDQLEALRRAGKRVFAHLLSGTMAEYYVASAADRIYLDPAIDLDLIGMTMTKVYLRGSLDKLGTVPQFVKIDEFKDAPEAFTETGPSAASTKQTDELLDSLWARFLIDVASARKIDKTELVKLIDGGPYTASTLAGSKLIDGVATTEELERAIDGDLGRHLPIATTSSKRPKRWNAPRIAIIHIVGTIVRGKSPPRSFFGGGGVGDETIVDALKSAREDSTVGAIVLRVNSPGGDAVASDLISREVFATRGKKPIICSFGDYAASGGYFVAAGCDQIIAEPTTITGSIGVFAGQLDVSAAASALGIKTVTSQRGARARIYDALSLPILPLPISFHPWTDDERAVLMVSARHAYDRFVDAVARGRSLKPSDVDAIGRGRVWSGAQALDVKLVDRLGSINDAVDEAARRGGVPTDDKIEMIDLPKTPGFIEWLRGNTSADTDLTTLERASLIQARLPYDIVW